MNQQLYKLKVLRLETGEIEVVGNRAGLKDLAEVCRSLSELSDEAAGTPANHYHIADYMNNAEEGSLQLLIRVEALLQKSKTTHGSGWIVNVRPTVCCADKI